jgi:hypothetical protein
MRLLEPKTCELREEARKDYGNSSIHAINLIVWGDGLYIISMHALVSRWRKAVDVNGDYVKK